MSPITLVEHTSRRLQDDSSAVVLTVVRRRKASGAKPPSSDSCHTTVVTDGAAPSMADQYTVRIPSRPVELPISGHWSVAKLRTLAATMAALGMGLFLMGLLPSATILRSQIVTVSVVCLVIGAFLLPRASRVLFGRLRVDSYGIRLYPPVSGFAIPWQDLAQWNEVKGSFWFRSLKSPQTFGILEDELEPGDRAVLGQVLLAVAPEQQRLQGA